MRKEGNGAVEICIENILKTFKTEIPYARDKGIEHKTLDLPADEVEQQLMEDAEAAIEKYETRVDIDSVEIDPNFQNGECSYRINVLNAENDGE